MILLKWGYQEYQIHRNKKIVWELSGAGGSGKGGVVT